MVESDVESLGLVIAGVYELNTEILTPQAFAIWFRVLEDYSFEEAESAFIEYLKSDETKTIPSPKEIITLLNQGTREQELLNQAKELMKEKNIKTVKLHSVE